MTRRADMPSVEDVQIAIKQLGEATGKPPTVLALARQLDLANTTFRRNFPEIAAELHHQRSPAPSEDPRGLSRFNQLKLENDELRRDKHELAEHLELASANIQRLSLDNHQLRQQLEATSKVTQIRPRLAGNPRSTVNPEPGR